MKKKKNQMGSKMPQNAIKVASSFLSSSKHRPFVATNLERCIIDKTINDSSEKKEQFKTR